MGSVRLLTPRSCPCIPKLQGRSWDPHRLFLALQNVGMGADGGHEGGRISGLQRELPGWCAGGN